MVRKYSINRSSFPFLTKTCCPIEHSGRLERAPVGLANSDLANKRFAWRFSTAFGTATTTLRVRLYDAVTSGLLLDDNTTSPTGTWEKSTDGGTNWVAYNTTDKGNELTYIRYTPATLPDNIKIRPLLTLY